MIVQYQQRWKRVEIEVEKDSPWCPAVDVSQLAASPLRELRLSRFCTKPEGLPVSLESRQVLDKLSIIHLYESQDCLLLFPLAPNLGPLTMRNCCAIISPILMETLHDTDWGIEELTCSNLQHPSIIDLPVSEIQQFLERRPRCP